MSNFALDTNSSAGDIISSLNYALSNLGGNPNAVTADPGTGQIILPPGSPTGNVNIGTGSTSSYINQYIDVKFANTATGSSGFSSDYANKQYFGVYNTASKTISSNPADYIWTQVTNGFGTTKQLWYQTIGGRQISFFAGNAAPASTFDPVPSMPFPTSAPIDLDVLTGVANNLAINVNAYYQANTAPATPTGGFYNFPTLTLTPPTGWSSTIPNFVANTSIYVSSAAFVGNLQANVPPSTLWTSPTVYASQFNGNTGAQGARGFVPLGFVVCASDPISSGWGDAQYTAAFTASRANPSPPIGLGYTPITGDTAQFFYANIFNPNNDVTITKSFNSNTSPQWANVTSQVVSGGLIVPGTITANTLNANQVYAITIQSTNATIGDNNSPGYWFQANTGDGRFGGNLSIGDHLTIGAGAHIGSNLVVGDSAGIGNNLIVGNSALIGNNLTVGTDASVGNNLTVGQNAQVGANLNIGDSATIGNNLTVGTGASIGGVIIAGSLAAGTVGNLQLQSNLNGGVIAANTIIGTSIVTGSITADKLAANVLVVGNITSFGSTIEVPSGTGYWLDYTNGNVYFGGNTTIGNSLKVGQNASIGNNLTVGTNATIGGVIIGGVIATNQVGNVQLQSNLDGSKLANNSVYGATIISLDGGKINAGSITTTQIGSNAIAAAQIQANAVTAGKIAANAVTAGTIAAGSVTAGAISANAITAGTIAAGAISSYSLQASSVTASAIAAGSISTGSIQAGAVTATQIASQTITASQIAAGTITAVQIAAQTITGDRIAANTVTGNNINANTVTTTNLVFNSATGSTSEGPTYAGTYPVAYYNNASYWPINTRGFAQDHGLSYVPQLSGNVQTNTRLNIVFSGYVFSGNAATIVELWKSGGSAYYLDNYYSIKCLPPNGTALSSDAFYAVGSNGSVAYNYNNGSSGSWVTERLPNNVFVNYNNTMPIEAVTGTYSYSSPALNPSVMLTSQSGIWLNTQSNVGNYYSFGTVSNIGIQYGASQSAGLSNYGTNNPVQMFVGQNGMMYQMGATSLSPNITTEATGVIATLNSIDFQQGPSAINQTNVVTVAVGTNGTIIRNVYSRGDGKGVGTGWVQKASGIISNLNAVRCNWATNFGTGSLWCAVGDYGIILTSTDGNSWFKQTSPTTQNLYGLTYGNGYWCAVGANSTIVYSADGTTWTAVQGPQGNDGAYRQLNTVAFGEKSNSFIAAGQSIIMKASTTPASWATQYDGGVSVTSNLTRLVSYGSDGANIANVTVPGPSQQLGSQVVSGQYIDYNYSAGVAVTYYLVMGNLTGNAVSTNSATLQVTEFKR